MFNIFSKILQKQNNRKLDFEQKFKNFQTLLEANNLAHKYMSELSDITSSGEPFSRGASTKLLQNLFSNMHEITEHLSSMSNGRYKNLTQKVNDIQEKIAEFLKTKINCVEGWDCPTFDCEDCNKARKLFSEVEYTYDLNKIDNSYQYEVGSKMSRLAEIRKKLSIPVPDGFCITVKLFEEYMQENSLRDQKQIIYDNLDFHDLSQIQNASIDTLNLFISNPLPEHLENLILEAYDKTFGNKNNVRLAVRSSAIGEDSSNYSFAGLHHTALNITRDNIVDACIEVLLSKYSPQSVVYRFISGLRDEDIPMSVGCMEMVDASAGGVLFTKDFNSGENVIIIQGVWGLGSLVVSGKVKPQEFRLEHSISPKLLGFTPGRQKYKNETGETGIKQVKVTDELNNTPCISAKNLNTLVEFALKIEEHFQCPQDIEWAIGSNGEVFILQARPLKIKSPSTVQVPAEETIDYFDSKYNVLINQGECASHGIASGKVFLINRMKDIVSFPEKSIIVAKRNLPEFTSLIHKASGVITDSGSTTGHLSIIARELNIPVLTNTNDATSKLSNDMEVTLYADECRVYSGKVAELEKVHETEIKVIKAYQNSPMWRIWQKISKFIFSLNLTDPNAENFNPSGCQTLHDIIRFSHEMAMRIMFSICENKNFDSTDVYSLKFDVPLDVFIIDLGGGLKPVINNKWVTVNDIKSEPMQCLINGMTTPGIRWSGHLPMDTKSYAKLIFGNIIDVNRSELVMGAVNYALISDKYVNFFSRLGYHFTRLDAFASDDIDINYINFNFRGGAADEVRKSRRGMVVSKILESYNFSIHRVGDNVIANIRKIPKDRIHYLLNELGRLMGAVRNTDVVMINQKVMDDFVTMFLEGDPAPAFTIFAQQ